MRILSLSTATCVTTLLFSTPAFADLILSSTGAFQPMVSPTALGPSPLIANPNQPPKPYWDQQSIDASTPTAGCNVGWVVTGGSLAGCSNLEGPIPFTRDDGVPNSYWGLANGNYDPIFMFHSNAVDATELDMTATSLGSDVFGYYFLSGGAPQLVPLFGSGDLAVLRARTGGRRLEEYGPNIPFNATFGYYLFNGVDTFFTDSSLNTTDKGIQHFALFGVPSTASNVAPQYYIGAEDGHANTDFDYQDMIIHVGESAGGGGPGGGGPGNPEDPSLAVPEPASLVLVSTMFAGVILAVRRRALTR
jgi:hypothetical protein